MIQAHSRPKRTGIVFILALSLLSSGMPAWADPGTPNPTKARSEGRSDGNPDGRREGSERGREDGRRRGEIEGYREGFDRCEREERQRYYDLGYSAGYREGEISGVEAGRYQGEQEGRDSGIREGEADGRSRADRDAHDAATPLGSAQGIKEANASDATARGRTDGLKAGDEQARETARRVDYPRGRKAYYDEQFAENVENEDSFSQKSASRQDYGHSGAFVARDGGITIGAPAMGGARVPAPDYRYYRPRRTYPHPSENTAYRDGYRNGYHSGFNGTYSLNYNQEYRSAYRYAYDRGCLQAKSKDYRFDYDRGYREGRARGYDVGYRRAYDSSYRIAYDREFGPSSERAYQQAYPSAYDRHYEAARSAAYAARYQALYQASFERAREEKYNAVYPGYAREEFTRGRRDEAEDFRLRPLRLLDASVTETIVNGVYEPGEPLNVRVNLRNFAAGSLAGRDVRLSVAALDAQSAIIAIGEEILVRDLRAKSVTDVSRALEIRLNPVAAGKVSRFAVRARYQGQEGGEKTVSVQGKYMLDTRFESAPSFSEGMPTSVRVRIRNQSDVAVQAGTRIEFKSDASILEVLTPNVRIGALAAGEETVAEFSAIARKSGQSVQMPMLFNAWDGVSGRSIGLLDATGEYPVLNDYTIRISTDAAELRKPGITRIEYVIKNVSSRLNFQPLQLKAKVNTDELDVFTIIGPNPQLLSPLIKNQQAVFVVPVHSASENSGGELELEVRENGNTVVIHRVQF